jgi:hypothetical protein
VTVVVFAGINCDLCVQLAHLLAYASVGPVSFSFYVHARVGKWAKEEDVKLWLDVDAHGANLSIHDGPTGM